MTSEQKTIQVLRLFNNTEYIVEEDEAENIMQCIDKVKFIRLRNGTLVNVSAISDIGKPETMLFWGEYPINKDGRSFNRDGERVWITEKKDLDQIKHHLHPKYGLGTPEVPSLTQGHGKELESGVGQIGGV